MTSINGKDYLTVNSSLILAVVLIGGMGFFEVYSVQAILPILQKEFQADAVSVGATVGATVIAMAIMSPIIGMLSDRIGRRVLINLGAITLGALTVLMAVTPSLQNLVMLRFLQGLVIPGMTVVLIAYLAEECAPRDLARIMSWYVTATVVGGFLGRFTLGYLTGLLDWRSAFAIMGVINVCTALVVIFILPPSHHFHSNKRLRISWMTLVHHLRDTKHLRAFALGTCVLFSLVGCFTYINLHLARPPFNYSPIGLANIFVVYLMGVIITPFTTSLIARFGIAHTIVFAICCSMLGVLLTLAPWVWLIVIGLILMSCGVFITQAATINYISMSVHKGRSLATGLYYMFYYAGGTLGTLVCGYAFEHGDWVAVVASLVVVQLFAILLASGLKVHLRRPL